MAINSKTVLWFALTMVLCGVPLATNIRSQAAKTPVAQVTIDGEKDPGGIPEWILWREILNIAKKLADQATPSRLEMFLSQLGLSPQSFGQLATQAIELERSEASLHSRAQTIKNSAAGAFTQAIRQQLRQVDQERQNRVLQLRDLIRGLLLPDEYARLCSWARLQTRSHCCPRQRKLPEPLLIPLDLPV